MLKRLTQLISNSDKVEWAGSLLAIVGAILIALNMHLEIFAFLVYLVSNTLLIIFAVRKKHHGILIMTLCFVIINIIGIVRWF